MIAKNPTHNPATAWLFLLFASLALLASLASLAPADIHATRPEPEPNTSASQMEQSRVL